MDKKQCSKCNELLPNTEEYFYLDKAKVRLGHNIILSAACKRCKNEAKKPQQIEYRKRIAEEYGTCYRRSQIRNPDYNKKCNEREKKYKQKKNARAKKYRELKTAAALHGLELNKARCAKEVSEMSDYYIARNLSRHSDLSPSDFLEYPSLIEAVRSNLKLKRLCRQLKTSTS